jgi:hypothetical protein
VKSLANPKDRGAITDPAQIEGVGRILALHQKDVPKVVPEEPAKRTRLQAAGDTLVGVIKLEHQ